MVIGTMIPFATWVFWCMVGALAAAGTGLVATGNSGRFGYGNAIELHNVWRARLALRDTLPQHAEVEHVFDSDHVRNRAQGLSVRIIGDGELALENLRADQYWAGAVELSLKDLLDRAQVRRQR